MPRIDDRDIDALEVSSIARRNRGPTRLRDTSDQRIAQIDDTTGPPAISRVLG